MSSAHENAVDRTRLDAQRAKHALGIVDREAGDLEPLAVLHSLFADVNAIHRAGLSALVARNARRQIVAV